MTVQYLQRLFRSDLAANEAVIQSFVEMEKAGTPLPERAVRLMGHTIVAHNAWLARMRHEDIGHWEWMPITTTDEMKANAHAAYKLWADLLQSKSDEDLHKKVTAKRNDQVLEISLADMCMHLLTHSHYHRGQIATLVRQGGGEPAVTGFFLFALQNP